jgi:hypothetical protein
MSGPTKRLRQKTDRTTDLPPHRVIAWRLGVPRNDRIGAGVSGTVGHDCVDFGGDIPAASQTKGKASTSVAVVVGVATASTAMLIVAAMKVRRLPVLWATVPVSIRESTRHLSAQRQPIVHECQLRWAIHQEPDATECVLIQVSGRQSVERALG